MFAGPLQMSPADVRLNNCLEDIQMPLGEDIEMPLDEAMLPEPAAPEADIDLPDHTAQDNFMLEEEIEVERYALYSKSCALTVSSNIQYRCAMQWWLT